MVSPFGVRFHIKIISNPSLALPKYAEEVVVREEKGAYLGRGLYRSSSNTLRRWLFEKRKERIWGGVYVDLPQIC
jgi:hypothetical protein